MKGERERREPGARPRRLPLALLVAFLVIAAALGVRPRHRDDWLLENALTVLGVLALAASWRRMPLSRISYVLVFAFLVLHEVGAHYTYSEVPYDAWAERLTGESLSARFGFGRNHYDRLVHLAYGLLCFYPFREVFVRVAEARGFWGYFLPLDLVLSSSLAYELIEWGTALWMADEELGQTYLGMQGDAWDAHKDMLLAGLGAGIALGVTAAVHRALDRDFQREWAESLRVKDPRPLGEVAIRRMRDEG